VPPHGAPSWPVAIKFRAALLRILESKLAVISIQPIQAKTVAGWPVVIDGLYPVSSDFLHGTITPPSGNSIGGSWDAHGRCRDQHPDCNLDLDNGALGEAIETADALRKHINRP
jgi:hypothetical protein